MVGWKDGNCISPMQFIVSWFASLDLAFEVDFFDTIEPLTRGNYLLVSTVFIKYSNFSLPGLVLICAVRDEFIDGRSRRL